MRSFTWQRWRTFIRRDTWAGFASIHEGTKNLRDAIDGYGRLDRLVNISTQLVIGPEYQPRSLLDFRPYTIYGEAKAYAEALLLQWQSKTHWLTIRPANILGPVPSGICEGHLEVHPETRVSPSGCRPADCAHLRVCEEHS